MFFFNNNKKDFYLKEKDLLKNPKKINYIFKMDRMEIIEEIENSIKNKEWLKINHIFQNLKKEDKEFIIKEIKENQVMSSKIYSLLFEKENINEITFINDKINKEINKNIDW